MPNKLPAKYAQRFKAICKDMADLIDERHASGHPYAVVFLEDGTPSLYAHWTSDMDRHPPTADVSGSYWHKAGGGAM